jgi:hypothetical protein
MVGILFRINLQLQTNLLRLGMQNNLLIDGNGAVLPLSIVRLSLCTRKSLNGVTGKYAVQEETRQEIMGKKKKKRK